VSLIGENNRTLTLSLTLILTLTLTLTLFLTLNLTLKLTVNVTYLVLFEFFEYAKVYNYRRTGICYLW